MARGGEGGADRGGVQMKAQDMKISTFGTPPPQHPLQFKKLIFERKDFYFYPNFYVLAKP
jgi:hypothetical protein